jgi:hypothetical protein
MVKFQTVKLHLKLPFLLVVCHHAGVTTIQLPHDQVDEELRVTMGVKPLDPELGGDVQVVDKGLILRHIVCCVKM